MVCSKLGICECVIGGRKLGTVTQTEHCRNILTFKYTSESLIHLVEYLWCNSALWGCNIVGLLDQRFCCNTVGLLDQQVI